MAPLTIGTVHIDCGHDLRRFAAHRRRTGQRIETVPFAVIDGDAARSRRNRRFAVAGDVLHAGAGGGLSGRRYGERLLGAGVVLAGRCEIDCVWETVWVEVRVR